jgi:hypothetical protein
MANEKTTNTFDTEETQQLVFAFMLEEAEKEEEKEVNGKELKSKALNMLLDSYYKESSDSLYEHHEKDLKLWCQAGKDLLFVLENSINHTKSDPWVQAKAKSMVKRASDLIAIAIRSILEDPAAVLKETEDDS